MIIEGTRCLVSLNAECASWFEATVARVNETGTYQLRQELDSYPWSCDYYGVTRSEISVGDEALWENVFPKIMAGNEGFSREDLACLFQLLRCQPSSVRARPFDRFWSECCRELFQMGEIKARDARLSAAQAYLVLRRLGFSAKLVASALLDRSSSSNPSYHRSYQHQIRMGGRDPAEIDRTIILQDAFQAMGVSAERTDHERAQRLEKWEFESGVKLPGSLATFLTREGISKAVTSRLPNSPELIEVGTVEFSFLINLGERGFDGDYAFSLARPHQGYRDWYAVFNEGEEDARVYLGPTSLNAPRQEWLPIAPTLSFFFWDLALAGQDWAQDVLMRRRKRPDKGSRNSEGRFFVDPG